MIVQIRFVVVVKSMSRAIVSINEPVHLMINL